VNCFLLRTSFFPYSGGKEGYFRLIVSTERHSTKLKEFLTWRNESRRQVLVLQEDKVAFREKKAEAGFCVQLPLSQRQDVVFIAQIAE